MVFEDTLIMMMIEKSLSPFKRAKLSKVGVVLFSAYNIYDIVVAFLIQLRVCNSVIGQNFVARLVPGEFYHLSNTMELSKFIFWNS